VEVPLNVSAEGTGSEITIERAITPPEVILGGLE
jgi:hypothetical protein